MVVENTGHADTLKLGILACVFDVFYNPRALYALSIIEIMQSLVV